MGGFSPASVILSYFLVAGGLLAGTLVIGEARITSEVIGFVILAAGAFVGGFFAARASRGSTIIEPVIGSVLFIATIILMVAGSDAGKLMWGAEGVTSVGKVIGELAGSTAIGALAGAFLSEKIMGEATESAIPWVLYSTLTAFGASFVGMFLAAILFVKGHSGADASSLDEYTTAIAKMVFAGMGIGCLLAGLAIGASARMRVLAASFVGGALGCAGFFLVIATLQRGHQKVDNDVIAGLAILSAGGAIVTLVGSVLGWSIFGKRNAG